MLKAIKRLFSKEKQAMARWSPERFSEVKTYLETKPPDELTEEDWNLVVEWLGQRYLPDDGSMTEERWQRRLDEFRAKIAFRIRNPGPPEPQTYVTGVVERAGDPEFTKWLNEHLSKAER